MMGRSLMLLAVVGGLGVALAAPPGQPPSNPHGDPEGCLACHAPPGADPSADPDEVIGPASDIVATCRSCHPTADMHVVSVAPEDVAVPEGWPLEDGKLTCATCHVEPAHGGDERVAAPYHRGGPYKDVRKLCFQCHDATEYTRSDPHHPGPNLPTGDPSCAACHSGVPTQGAAAAESRLRFPTSAACRTCHEGEVHQGVATHIGLALDPSVQLPADARLPLDAEGAMQCWTCHQVHPDRAAAPVKRRHPLPTALTDRAKAHDWMGLVPQDAAWPGSAAPDHPPLLALPLEDDALCSACHGDGP